MNICFELVSNYNAYTLMGPTFIVAILICSFEPHGPGFKLASPASRIRIATLKDGREGGSGSSLQLKHTFKL